MFKLLLILTVWDVHVPTLRIWLDDHKPEAMQPNRRNKCSTLGLQAGLESETGWAPSLSHAFGRAEVLLCSPDWLRPLYSQGDLELMIFLPLIPKCTTGVPLHPSSSQVFYPQHDSLFHEVRGCPPRILSFHKTKDMLLPSSSKVEVRLLPLCLSMYRLLPEER